MTILSRFVQNKPLSEVSTFGIGGPARYFFEAHSVEDMKEALAFCKENKVPYFVLGKGSNSLFDDRGFNGLVLSCKLSFCHYEGSLVSVGAGYSFSLLGVQTARKGFSGLEFASGIPGSVGGAVYMNAGANGKEICDVVSHVEYLNDDGDVVTLSKEEISFSYRTSMFQKKKGVILSASFSLTPCSEARKKQLEIVDYRLRTQPYQDKSAGCVFRNPNAEKAGALIDLCGLKGFKIGGAEVSEMHANFIVNKNGSTAKDVLDLARHIQHVVKEKTGIELEMEVRQVPYQGEL